MVEELHAELERALPAPARGPGDPLSVTSFARREDFARYAGALLDDDEMPELALGVYVAPTRDLLLVGGGDPERLRRVLRHEATHAYVDGFVAEPPPWLSEGLADAIAAGGEHPERSEGLRRAAEGCDGRRLRSLLAADGAEFLGVEEAELADRARAAGDNYALAFALVDLLRARHGARLRAAWETLVEGRSAETVAEAAVGARDTEALAAEVREHAARLLRATGR